MPETDDRSTLGGRGIDKRFIHDITGDGVVVCSRARFLPHNDEVVESTTSRPLHTVGTTVAAEAADGISNVSLSVRVKEHFSSIKLFFYAQKHDAISV